jgi:hypothetical protein
MSQQKLDSRRQQNTAVCSKNKSPLAPRDGSGGPALRAGNSSTGSTKSESNLYVGFPTQFIPFILIHEWKGVKRALLAASPASYYDGYVGVAEMNEKRYERAIFKSIDR